MAQDPPPGTPASGRPGSIFRSSGSSPREPRSPDLRHAALEPGSTLGDYRILRPLGQGGMGVVYEAEQSKLHRRVALKVLSRSHSVSDDALDRFRREAEAGGRLSHSGIVAVYDFGHVDGIQYIAQELIPGACDLADVLNAVRALPQVPADYYREAAEVIAEAAEALQVAHEAGVIHRDIKPSNILVTDQGSPKIADFGLAKVQDAVTLSMTGDVLGTPFYMSPEQIRAQRGGVDVRTDIFSLGSTFYELLTLRRPFDGDTAQQVFETILHEDPLEPRRLRGHVPAELSIICTKAMEKRREDRYATMAELAGDLRRHLAHQPILARPPGRLRRLQKWVLRHPTRSATLGVGASALVLVTALLVRTLQAERETARRAGELEQVAEFQAEQLSGIDPQVMGIRLYRALLEAAPEAQREALEQDLGGINFTNIALGTLRDNLFDQTLQAIDSQFAEQPLVQAQLLQTMADSLRSLGLLDDATAPQERALSLRREHLGDAHPDTLTSVGNLGTLFRAQGKLDEAELRYREALDGRRRVLGDEHPDTLISLNEWSILLLDQGKTAEAEVFAREVLEARRRILGNEHRETLVSLNSLGHMLQVQGKLAEAEAYFREALETRRRVFGDQHPSTLLSINNLGSLLHEQGQPSEAEACFLEALDGRRRVLGDQHPGTLSSLNSLAVLRHTQGRLVEAEESYREVIEARRRLLGNEHPTTLLSINNLGVLLEDQGRLAEAEVQYREALEGRLHVLGDQHPKTRVTLNCLDGVLQAKLSHARREATQDPDPQLELARILAESAELQVLQTNLREADTHLDEALEILEDLDEEPTWRSRRLRARLARIATSLGHFEDAEALVLESAEWVLMSDPLPPPEDTGGVDVGVEVLESVILLYDTLHAAQPDDSFDEEAQKWREELVAWMEERRSEGG